MCATANTSSTDDAFDRRMMARALALARRGEGRVEPNPMVGCVIVRGKRILGEGYHRRFGGPHAEIEALRECDSPVRGTTIYVTLEPCCHEGKTPPCCDALVKAGVRRVVTATRDPNRLVCGKGIRRLRAAGIHVDVGLLKNEAEEILAPYLTRVQRGRPYVIAKWAQSLDGKLATHTGDSKWISCEESRRQVHRLRARVDAILVGSTTVLQDDPRLTARDVRVLRTATRIVLDSRLRVSRNSCLVQTAHEMPTAIFTTLDNAKSPKADRLRHYGVDVFAARSAKPSQRYSKTRSGLDPRHVLENMASQGVTNLLLEGGPTLLSSFLAAQLVDEALVFTAPILIGGQDAPGPLNTQGSDSVDVALKPHSIVTKRSGTDTVHRLRFAT